MACLCPHDSRNTRMSRNPLCPEHGDTALDPNRYEFNDIDRLWLKHKLRISPLSPEAFAQQQADIQQIRQADEDRFRERN
jgi:hypothetical protein